MTLTVADELIDALQDVTDLDHLHALLSNDHVDRHSPTRFVTWLIDLVNAERKRRLSDAAETDYPMGRFEEWPPADLYASTAITLSIAEATIIAGEPTNLQFALRLQQLLVGSMGLAFLALAAQLGRT